MKRGIVLLIHLLLQLYTLWLDSTNFTEFTRPWYAKVLPFPLNYFVPGRMAQRARSWINKGGAEIKDEVLEKKVLIIACMFHSTNFESCKPHSYGQ